MKTNGLTAMETLIIEKLSVEVGALTKKVERLERIAGEASQSEAGDLITTTQAAWLLGIAIGTLYNWVDQGKILCVKLPNGRARFSRREITNWMASGEQKGKPLEGQTL